MWTFSFCSNARSFDRPTAAKSGEKIKVPIFIRRKGADAFRPALAAGGSLMAYRCLLLCGLFSFKGFCKSLFQIGFDFSQVVSRSLHCKAENLLLFWVSEIAGNDTATGCQDWLLFTPLGLKSIKSHDHTAEVLAMGLFVSGSGTPLSRCNTLDFVPKSCAKGDYAPLKFPLS